MEGWLQAVVAGGIFVLSVIGAFAVYEFRRTHNRIDKYVDEMREHFRESTGIHREIAEIHTKVDLHMENGHRHKED